MASERTLTLREAAREMARATYRAPVAERPTMPHRENGPNPNRILVCETCKAVFSEAEAFQGPGGFAVCPNCGMETA